MDSRSIFLHFMKIAKGRQLILSPASVPVYRTMSEGKDAVVLGAVGRSGRIRAYALTVRATCEALIPIGKSVG